MADRVEVFAGYCEVDNGELYVSHALWRAVHPLMVLAMLSFLLMSIYLYVNGPRTWAGGATYQWYDVFLMFLMVAGVTGYEVLSLKVATDKRIPLSSVRAVRLDTEQRRGYFKRTHTIPVVIVEYVADGDTTTYPIRLHRRHSDYEWELVGLVGLFEAAGVPVEDEAGWLVDHEQ